MTTPRNQIVSVQFMKLSDGSNIGPKITLDTAFQATLPGGEQLYFNPGVLSIGRTTYDICRDFLPSGSQLFYKSYASNTLYSNPYDVFDAHPTEKVFCCRFSRAIPPDSDNYIMEYFFDSHFGVGGRMLTIEPLWLANQDITTSIDVKLGSTGVVTTVYVNPNGSIPEPPVGLFFKSGSYDAVTTTLGNYYDYRCTQGSCFTLSTPTPDWLPHLSSGNVIDNIAIGKYWNNVKSQLDPNSLIASMVKHDRSGSRGILKAFMMRTIVSKDEIDKKSESSTVTLSPLG